MPPRRAKRGAVLQTISENVTVDDIQKEALNGFMQAIKNVENEVEERVNSIVSTTEDMIISLKNGLKASIVRLPKKTRDMRVSEFLAKYPKDFKTDAIQEIRQRFAAMADEAAKAIPPATKKRTAETNPSPKRSIRPKNTHSHDEEVIHQSLPRLKDKEHKEQLPEPAGAVVQPAVFPPQKSGAQFHEQKEPPCVKPQSQQQHPTNKSSSFNGLPLQTPMPFAGEAIPLPFTMIAQKRGARTRAAPAPDAAVITTADGMQWAVGKEGMASIPESHKAEIQGILNDQVSFLMTALGKTVFKS